MILSDNETKVDLLNSEAIAKTIVNLITERPDHPITVGVHGDWGAGKSSVLEMIEVELDGKENILVIKFNGWRFQGFEDAKISLIEGIVTELVEKKSLWTKAKEEVVDIYERIDWLKAAKKAGGLIWTAVTGIPSAEIVQSFLGGIQKLVDNPSELATKDNLQNVLHQANSILKPKDDSKKVPTQIREFRKSFDELLEKAKIKQLVVLVDDLDRCLPETAIETLEAIRLFVFTTKTAFIVATDEGMIEYAVKRHFPDFPETTGAQLYSRNYLEKLIQVPFRIPVLGELETRIYVTLLLIGCELGDNDADFEKLIKAAREKLKKPWESSALDTGTVKEILGTKKFHNVQSNLLISDQIGPVLASGTKGNPRQIKRFLNTLILRKRTADARGFGELINMAVLAKLMIAERFLPRLFEQIASSSAMSPDGKCIDLEKFELSFKEKATNNSNESVKKETKKEGAKKNQEESVYLPEWKNNNDIIAWAKLSPELSDVDLRPYIFVSKDKKDYFIIDSSLGHLTAIAEKLLGKKFVIQALEPELKKLSPQDLRKLFDSLRNKIVLENKFDNEPEGLAGISAIVRLQPVLQPELLDFLETLPKDRTGPWVVKGWEGTIIGESEKQRFQTLLTAWSTSKNPILQSAASNVQTFKAR